MNTGWFQIFRKFVTEITNLAWNSTLDGHSKGCHTAPRNLWLWMAIEAASTTSSPSPSLVGPLQDVYLLHSHCYMAAPPLRGVKRESSPQSVCRLTLTHGRLFSKCLCVTAAAPLATSQSVYILVRSLYLPQAWDLSPWVYIVLA